MKGGRLCRQREQPVHSLSESEDLRKARAERQLHASQVVKGAKGSLEPFTQTTCSVFSILLALGGLGYISLHCIPRTHCKHPSERRVPFSARLYEGTAGLSSPMHSLCDPGQGTLPLCALVPLSVKWGLA